MSSDHKPGFFARLRNAITSTIDGAVDSATDPGQELALMLDDLGAQIKQAEQDHRQAVVDRKMMERKIAGLTQDEAGWLARAEQALRAGEEALARAALTRKNDVSEELHHLENALGDQIATIESMAEQIRTAKARYKSLNLRRGSLMAQARAHKRGADADSPFGASPLSKLEEIEGKIAELEAYNEVSSSFADERVSDMRLEAKLASLGPANGRSVVDDQLEALKAKMAAPKSLTAARDADDDDDGDRKAKSTKKR